MDLPSDIWGELTKRLSGFTIDQLALTCKAQFSSRFKLKIRIPGCKVTRKRGLPRWAPRHQKKYLVLAPLVGSVKFQIFLPEDFCFVVKWLNAAATNTERDRMLVQFRLHSRFNKDIDSVVMLLCADYPTENWPFVTRIEIDCARVHETLENFFVERCPCLQAIERKRIPYY